MKDEIKKELEGLSPKLAKLRQSKSVPELPDTLFHNMQQSVIQELKSDLRTTVQPEKKSWWAAFLRPVPAMSFATCLALAVAGFYFFGEEATTPEFAFEEITDDEILVYIDNNIDDFESVSLLELSDEEEEDLFEGDIDDSVLDEFLDQDDFDESAFEQLF